MFNPNPNPTRHHTSYYAFMPYLGGEMSSFLDNLFLRIGIMLIDVFSGRWNSESGWTHQVASQIDKLYIIAWQWCVSRGTCDKGCEERDILEL